MKLSKLAITSPSFSQSETLLNALKTLPVEILANTQGLRMNEDSLSRYLHDNGVEILIVGLEPVTKRVILENPQLKFVAKYGVGTDNIDISTLNDCKIGFGWMGGVNRRSVSELVLAFALGHMRNVIPSILKMKSGQWQKQGGVQLSNSTFGIIGLGHIGLDLAKVLQGFGCRILGFDILDKSNEVAALGIELQPSLQSLLSHSDIVSLHVPSTDKTRRMIGPNSYSHMKNGVFIINTARGDIVDHQWLCGEVMSGTSKISGYAADVFENEPCDLSIWSEHPNLYFTPHIGGNSRQAVEAMGLSAIEHVRKFLL